MRDLDFSEFTDPAEDAGEVIAAGDGDVSVPKVSLSNPQAGQYRYYFLSPPKVNGKVLRSIVISQPSQKQIDAYFRGEIATRREFIAALCGVHPAVIAALIWPDSQAIHHIFHDIVPDFVKE